jgi:endonuclease YncB( thermonuclease family)
MRKFNAAALLLISTILIASFVFAADGVDYASQVKLNMNSETAKLEVTVETFVDGDTTHFNVDSPFFPSGIVKARYLGLNTPESTGKIEEYGKAASKFTRSKLENASSIIIESDDANWNPDSSGGRYLVWVWYRNSDREPYRNLNIELLQNGLANAYSTANNRYGTTAMAALNQAKAQKLNLYSGQKDPDFYYGDAIELTLKELRLNVLEYEGKSVAFEGVITLNDGASVYIEDYDPDTGLYYGISVFYGYNLPGKGLEILSVGNRSRIVGKVQYYETGGIYQVAGLTYKQMKPKDPGNIQKISSGHEGAYVLTSAEVFNSNVTIHTDDGEKVFPYAYLALDTTIEMHDLKVLTIKTEDNPGSSSDGAMTITCESNGSQVIVRTASLTDSSGKRITHEAFDGKTINVRGVVNVHHDYYEIKVLSAKDITVIN